MVRTKVDTPTISLNLTTGQLLTVKEALTKADHLANLELIELVERKLSELLRRMN